MYYTGSAYYVFIEWEGWFRDNIIIKDDHFSNVDDAVENNLLDAHD
jgi:hypothetical protein